MTSEPLSPSPKYLRAYQRMLRTGWTETFPQDLKSAFLCMLLRVLRLRAPDLALLFRTASSKSLRVSLLRDFFVHYDLYIFFLRRITYWYPKFRDRTNMQLKTCKSNFGSSIRRMLNSISCKPCKSLSSQLQWFVKSSFSDIKEPTSRLLQLIPQ